MEKQLKCKFCGYLLAGILFFEICPYCGGGILIEKEENPDASIEHEEPVQQRRLYITGLSGTASAVTAEIEELIEK